MEEINFNDFSRKERHEIIKAFLIKMDDANSMSSAERFYEYYFKKFYKVPQKLLNDIVYCQRALKSHLTVHQKVVKEVVVPDLKKNYLQDLENIVHELNAESQYLVLRLEDDIDQFCLAFTEHQLCLNKAVVNAVVSSAIASLISDSQLTIKPHYVPKRSTEQELLLKYFIKGQNEPNRQQQKTTPLARNSSLTNQVTPLPKQPAKADMQPAKDTATDKLPQSVQFNDENKNVVEASRLNLQKALERARSQKHQNDLKSIATTNDNAENNVKSDFLQKLGLCGQDK